MASMKAMQHGGASSAVSGRDGNGASEDPANGGVKGMDVVQIKLLDLSMSIRYL